MRLFNIYVLCAILIVPLVSCEHKELCYDHDPHALKYHVNVKASYEQEWQYTYGDATDWEAEWPEELSMSYESLRPDIPEGLRVLSFDETGRQEMKNMPASGGNLLLSEGSHSLLFTIMIPNISYSTSLNRSPQPEPVPVLELEVPIWVTAIAKRRMKRQ